MSFLAAALPLVAGALFGNAQNKANLQQQENAQNNAQAMSKEAAQAAQAQQLFQWVQMMQRYQQYLRQNPDPAQTWRGIQSPAPIQGTIGGGQIGPSGNPQMPGSQMPQQQMPPMPSFMPPMAPQMPQGQQNLTGMTQPGQARPINPSGLGAAIQPGSTTLGNPITPGGTQGMPLRYLQEFIGRGQ